MDRTQTAMSSAGPSSGKYWQPQVVSPTSHARPVTVSTHHAISVPSRMASKLSSSTTVTSPLTWICGVALAGAVKVSEEMAASAAMGCWMFLRFVLCYLCYSYTRSDAASSPDRRL